MKNADVVSKFVDGEVAKGSNLTSDGAILVNYNTAIAQHWDGAIILNRTYYSRTTSRNQHHLRVASAGKKVYFVEGVPRNATSLTPFLSIEDIESGLLVGAN